MKTTQQFFLQLKNKPHCNSDLVEGQRRERKLAARGEGERFDLAVPL